jgi:hypothetical protein
MAFAEARASDPHSLLEVTRFRIPQLLNAARRSPASPLDAPLLTAGCWKRAKPWYRHGTG